MTFFCNVLIISGFPGWKQGIVHKEVRKTRNVYLLSTFGIGGKTLFSAGLLSNSDV